MNILAATRCIISMWMFCIVCLYTQDQICADKTFNLQSNKNLSPKILLEEIAHECGLSLSYENGAQEALDQTKVVFNFRQKRLDEILATIAKASDTHYVLEQTMIRFSHLETRTFHINYIATARVGSSNTDVVYGQEAQSQYLQPYTSYYNYNTSQIQSSSPLDDNIQQKARSQGTQNPIFGKSGTKIYSIDELNFWGELENELIAIVYQENDSYNPRHPRIIINKGAGLITLSATPSQIERAKEYLNTLQTRLNQQVQIDVQIFSIEHFDSNTIGIK